MKFDPFPSSSISGVLRFIPAPLGYYPKSCLISHSVWYCWILNGPMVGDVCKHCPYVCVKLSCNTKVYASKMKACVNLVRENIVCNINEWLLFSDSEKYLFCSTIMYVNLIDSFGFKIYISFPSWVMPIS